MKILYVTTIGATMDFFRDFVEDLVNSGNTVDIATNDSERKVSEFFTDLGCRVFSISCSRSPFDKGNIDAIGEIRRIVTENEYDIVHCHTPVAAACTRMACRGLRKNCGVKVFYTAHGFHFYKGAPLKNWLIYYPVEKVCSLFTDVLVTINHEDYALAQKKMKAKKVVFVPGVGVDLSKFQNILFDRNAKRREIGVPEEAFLLFSVGELNVNKNHQIIIRALSKLNNKNVHYVIAGIGDRREQLLLLAKELGVSEQMHLLGYRNDIQELNHTADVFCFPSLREGLGLAAIEAMACGLPIVTSNVHGINDYSENDVTGYKTAPTDVDGFVNAIKKLKENPKLAAEIGQSNKALSRKYSIENIIPLMKSIYDL